MKELKLKFKSEFDYQSVYSGVEQISNALKNINIEDKVKSKLENYIKNVSDKLANLSRIDIGKEGIGAYKSALKDISREYSKLSNAANDIQLKDISFPKETIQQITNITNALDKLKLEREKLIESFQNTYAPTQKRFAASLFDKTSDERTRLKQSLESKQNERYERKVELGTLQKQTQSKINEATSKLSTETDDSKKVSLEEEIKKGKEELEKYNAELKNLNSQIKQTQTQLSILQSFKDSRQATAANKNANEIDNLTKELEDLNKSANDAAKQGLENFHNSVEKGNNAATDAIYNENKLIDANEDLNKSYDGINKKLTKFFSLAMGFRVVKQLVREAAQAVQEFDKSFTTIAMVSGNTREEMWGMFDTFNSMASRLGVTTQNVMESSKLFYQQGLDTNEVLLRTEATVKLATISGMDFTTATNQMTAALNGFNLEGKQANEVADIFANLAAKAAVDVSELSEALTKTASIAKSAGMSIDTTSAFLTKMIETTREAPENIGTAMKTIVARMQELKNSPTTLLEDGVDANKVEKALKEADVALRDSTGQFRNLDDVLLDLGSKWEGLDRNTQRYIATIIAGSRQQSRLLALLDDHARTLELVELAQNSQGAATIQQATNLESAEAKLNQLKATFEKFQTDLLNSDFLKFIYELGTNILKFINNAGAWTTIISAAVGLIIIKIGLYINKTKLAKKTQEEKNATDKKESAGLKALGARLKQIISLRKQHTRAIIAEQEASKGNTAQAKKELTATNRLNTEIAKNEAAANVAETTANTQQAGGSSIDKGGIASTLLSSVTGIFSMMGGWGAVVSMVVGLAASIIVPAIKNNTATAKLERQKEEDEKKYQEAKTEADARLQNINNLKILSNTLTKLNNKVVKTEEDFAELEKTNKDLKEAITMAKEKMPELYEELNIDVNNLTVQDVQKVITVETKEQLKNEQESVMAQRYGSQSEDLYKDKEKIAKLEDEYGGLVAGAVTAQVGTAALGVISTGLAAAISGVSFGLATAPAALGATAITGAAQYGTTMLEIEAEKKRAELEQAKLEFAEKSYKALAEQYSQLINLNEQINSLQDISAIESNLLLTEEEKAQQKKDINARTEVKTEISEELLLKDLRVRGYDSLEDMANMSEEEKEEYLSIAQAELDIFWNSLNDETQTIFKQATDLENITYKAIQENIGNLEGQTKEIYENIIKEQQLAQEKLMNGLENIGFDSDKLVTMTAAQLKNITSAFAGLPQATQKAFGEALSNMIQDNVDNNELINQIANTDFTSVASISQLIPKDQINKDNELLKAFADNIKFTSSTIKQLELDSEEAFKNINKNFDNITKSLSEGIATADKQNLMDLYGFDDSMFTIVEGQWKIIESRQNEAYAKLRESSIENWEKQIAILESQLDGMTEVNKAYAYQQIKVLEGYINSIDVQLANKAIEIVKKELQTKLDARKDYLSQLKKSYEEEKKLRQQNESKEELAEKEARLAFLMQDQTGANAEEIASLQKDIEKDRENLQEESVQQYFDSIQKSIDDETESLDNIDENSKDVKDLLEKWQIKSDSDSPFQDLISSFNSLKGPDDTNLGSIQKSIEGFIQQANAENKLSAARNSLQTIQSNLQSGKITKASAKELVNTAYNTYTKSVYGDNIPKDYNISKFMSDTGVVVDYEETKQENNSGQQQQQQPKEVLTPLYMDPDKHSFTGMLFGGGNSYEKGRRHHIWTDGVGSNITSYNDDNSTKFKEKYENALSGYGNEHVIYDSETGEFFAKIDNDWRHIVFDNSTKRNDYKTGALRKKLYMVDNNLVPYSKGGYVTETGPVMVHGTPNKPEAFLSAEDTAMMREFLNAMGQNRNFNFRNNNIPQKVENHTSVQNILNLKIEKVETEADIDEVIRQVESKFNEMSDRISVPYIR